MKKFLFCTMIASLLALTGCQKEELVNDNNTPGSGEKVILTANIQGAALTRVTLTPGTENGNPCVKVAWNESGETFEVYGSSGTSSTFTQIAANQFEGTLPESTNGEYEAIYGNPNSLDEQNGGLGQSTANDSPVFMSAMFGSSSSSITFEHATAILKPTFKVDGDNINNTITQIVIGNVAKPNLGSGGNGPKFGEITIAPTSPATVLDDDIYIHLIVFPQIYKADYEFTFTVTAGGKDYTGSLTIPTGMSIEEGKFYTATIALEEKIPYLTFTVGGEQSLVLNVMGQMDQSIEYSADGEDWKKFVMEGSNATTPVSFTNNLRMRGKSASGTYDFETSKGFMISFANVNIPVTCSGDIRTLVDYTNYETTSTATACFYELFKNCSALADASELKLISNNNEMAASCYQSMFAGCTSLTSAPALPATTLAECCYQSMFAECSKLISAPALPATTLAQSCYCDMFRCCESLESAPVLSAPTLAQSCYSGMFQVCTSLKTAPALPATTLAEYCYYGMFYNCASLKSAPALSATTLAQSCYCEMFQGCTSLTTAPALPATTLAESCYCDMFQGCTSLTTAPALPATTLAESCYCEMFQSCESLNSVTMLATDIAAIDCLTNWMEGVAATGTFIKAASMTSLPEGASGIPSGWTVTDYGQSEY